MSDAFASILDQQPVIAQITQSLETNRLPHGVIFAGPVGVGKATTAVALAKVFLAGENPAYTSRLIDAGTHPDFHLVTKELVRLTSKTSKATTLSIDVIINHVVTPAGRKSATGDGKVFVIEEADFMLPAAQNALLKTLEEPAGRTLIILLTPRPEDLLPTIRSRAQVFQFGALADKTIFNQLKLRGIDPQTAELATKLVDGSLGTALRWVEDGVIAQARDLIAQLDGLLSGLFGGFDGGRAAPPLGDWLKSAADAYAAKQIERDALSSKDFATRGGINVYLRLAARHLRGALRETDDPDALERVCQAIDAIAACERYLDGNVNIALALQQFGGAVGRGLATTR